MKQLSIYDFDLIETTEDQAHFYNLSSNVDADDNIESHPIKNPCSRFSQKSQAESENGFSKTTNFPANVTEIVLANDKIDSIQLILPMLINLHQESRWLAWIDPPIQLLKEWQKKHNEKALNDVMILRSNENLSVFELSQRALSAGTCHAVIAWTNNLSQGEFTQLEAASSEGNSHGIILKSRVC